MRDTKTPGKSNNIDQPSNTNGFAPQLAAALFGVSNIQNADKLAAEGKKHGSIVENIEQLLIGSKKAVELYGKQEETTVGLKTVITKASDSLSGILKYQVSNNNLLQALILTNAHGLDLVNQNIVLGQEALKKSIHQSLETIAIDITNKIPDSETNSKSGNNDNSSIQQTLNLIKSFETKNTDLLNDIFVKSESKNNLTAITGAINTFSGNFKKFADEPRKIFIPKDITANIANVSAGVELTLDGLIEIKDELIAIRKTQDKGATGDDGNVVKGVIDIIINGADKDVIESLKSLSEVKITDDSLLSVKQIENLKTYFEKLDELFKMQVAVAKSAEDAVKANQQTQKAIKSSHKAAIDANNNVDDIKEGTISLSELGNFLFKAGIILMIGALFMMIPGILKKCLMFAAALSLFITSIILPLQLISLINKDSKNFITSITNLKSLIVSCGFLMMLGSFFMMIPGIMKHALMFGVTLSLFIATLIIPFAIIGSINSGKAFEGIKNIKSLIITAAITMMIGALVVSLGGGKYVKSALLFGIALGTFILLVLLPITLYAVFVKNGVKGLHEINKLVVTATLVMMIGALFVMLGGGKFIKNALVFGILLSAFIGLILLPITIYSILVFKANKTLYNITKLIVVCTIIMMIGALFTMNSKLVVYALAFGLLLAAFITLVLTPIIMFSILSKIAMRSIKQFTILLIVCTIIMMVGAYFVQDWKRVVAAIAFTLLLAVFISSTMLAIGFFSNKYPGALKDMGIYALTIGIAGAVLMLGALLMRKYGWEAVGFAALLTAFIFLTMKAIDLAAKNNKRIGAGAFAFKQIAIAIGFISVAIGLLAIIGAEYGWDNVVYSATTLLVCTGILIAMFKFSGRAIPSISQGTVSISMIVAGLIILSVAISTMAIISKTFGWDNVLYGVVTLTVIAIGFGILYSIMAEISAPVTAGAIVMGAIASSLLILSAAIGLVAFIGDTFGWGAVVLGVVTLGVIALGFGKLYSIIAEAAAPVTAGAIVMLAIASSLLILSAALGLVTFIGDTFGWGAVVLGVVTLGLIALGFGILYSTIAALAAPVTAGAIVMLAIASSLLILSVALGLVTFIGDTYGWGAVVLGVATLAVIAYGFGALYAAILPLAVPVAIGAVVLLAIAGSLGVMTLVIWGIVALIKAYGEDKITNAPFVLAEFFGKLTVTFIAISVCSATAIPAIISLSLMTPAVLMLSTLLLAMGVSIKIFREGVQGFNVSSISKVIEEFIAAAPDFSLKAYLSTLMSLSRVKSLVRNMSDVTRIVAAAIQSIASLSVPTKWNTDGEPIKFRQLTENDFVSAGNSIRSIMITLSDAIVTTYTTYPKLFGSDAEDILYKVRRLALTQSFILHVLCSGIKSYAQLLIPTKWNKEGEPIKFRSMTEVDFNNAAKGIANVMTTIGKAIHDTYKNYPELFDDASKHILDKVSDLALSECFMLHVLSSGIKSYAQIMIPTKWNKDGIATEYRQMKPEEFTHAAENIAAVLKTMSFALLSVWDGKEYTIKVGDEIIKFGGDGKALGWYTLLIPYIIDSIMPMGDLIASISSGMASYAKLVIPTEWDRKGRPIKFQQMSKPQFQEAGTNIAKIITSLASAVQQGYNSIKPNNVWSKLFGPSPEEKIKALQPLGELISSISEGLANYAALQIPTKWDKKGRPVGYRTLGKDDFKLAAQNIADIILTLGAAIAISYDGGTIKFSDGSGWTIGKGLCDVADPDELKEIIDSYAAMGDIISNIASGIANYATLKIPTGWDRKGRPVGYKPFGKGDFTLAAQNIADIILTLGSAIAVSYSGGVIKFNNGSGFSIVRGLNDIIDPDELKEIMESYATMGDLISNIATGLQAYANLSVPRYGRGGKIISATPMKGEDMVTAGENIVNILMAVLIGKPDTKNIEAKNVKSGIIGAYNLLKECDLEDDIGDIIESLSSGGNLISNIATGLAAYADLKIATRWDKDGKPIKYRQLKDKDFEKAATNIATVLAITTKAIIWAWDGGELKIGNSTYSGDGISATFDDATVFGNITEQLGKVGNLISSIAEGIGKFAALQIPNKWNDQGNPIGYLKLTDNDFIKASQNIGKVVITMCEALVNAVALKPEYFEADADITFKNVVESITGVGNIIKNIADGINTFAKGGIPIYNKEGKIVGYDKIGEEDIKLMNGNVELVITALTGAVIAAGKRIDEESSSEEFKSAIDNVSKIGSLVKNIAEGVQAWANMKMPTGWKSDGSAKGYRKLKPEDITGAKANIVHIVKTLCEAMIEAANTKLSNGVILANFADSDIIPNILAVTSDITEVIKNLTDIVKNIAEFKIPTGYKSDGTVKGYNKLNKEHIDAFATTLENLLTIIPQTISNVYINNTHLFTEDFTKTTSEIYNVIGNIDSLVNGLMALIKTFSDNGKELQNFISFTSSLKAVNVPEGTSMPTVKIIADTYVIFDDLCKLAKLLKDNSPVDTSTFTSNWTTFLGNMSTLINDLAYSIVEPVSENVNSIQKLFIKGKTTDTSYNIGIFGDLGTIYGDLAKLGGIYGNKETINSLTSFNDNINTIDETLSNFSYIFTTLVDEIIYNLIDGKQAIDTISSSVSNNTNMKLSTFESIYNIVSDIDYILKTISTFEEIDANVVLNNITSFGNIFDTLVINVIDKLIAHKQYIDSVVADMNIDNELKLKPIEDLSAIINDVNTIISKLSDDISILGLIKAFKFDIFATNITNFKDIFNCVLNGVIVPVVKYNNQLVSFIQLTSTVQSENNLYKCAVFNDIYTIIKDVLTFNEKIGDLDDFNLKGVDIILKTTKDLYNIINSLVKYIVNPALKYHEKISLLYTIPGVRPQDTTIFYTGVISDIYGVIKDVNNLVNLVNTQVNEDIPSFGEGLTVLGNGLMCVIKALNEYEYNEGFAKGTDQLDRFIKNTVNQIDIEKIDRLISLTTSLNNLADKTTNLDELTKAIAEDLTTSLDELTKRMDESKQVIQLSEQIQQKRYQIITKVISEMRNIVNQPIDVIISVKDNNSSKEEGSTHDTGQQNTQGTNGASGGAQNTNLQGGGGNNAGNNGSENGKSQNKSPLGGNKNKKSSGKRSDRTLTELSNRLDAVETDVNNLKKKGHGSIGG